jgi:glycosyltransferase involved in cell wall biosynthesis
MGRLLTLVEASDHVCYRYRVRAFRPALAMAGWSIETCSLAGSLPNRLQLLSRASQYDAVLLQRKLLPTWQLYLLRRHAKRLIFDFDDAVLHRDSYDTRGPDSPRRLARFAAVMKVADVVLAGNDFLADCAARHGAADRVRVVPTCIETDRYPSEKTEIPKQNVDLVWVGSSSTVKGLEQRRGLLERLGREIPGLRLRLICDRFPDFGPLETVPVAWTEAGEVNEIGQGDIGVSWVPDDLWTRGKCGLKLLQYQAAGLPVVADPVGVHRQIVRTGFNGLLPHGDDEWVEAIRSLVRDPRRRRRMGRFAREVVEEDYSVDSWSDRFVFEVTGSIPSRASNSPAVPDESRPRKDVA